MTKTIQKEIRDSVLAFAATLSRMVRRSVLSMTTAFLDGKSPSRRSRAAAPRRSAPRPRVREQASSPGAPAILRHLQKCYPAGERLAQLSTQFATPAAVLKPSILELIAQEKVHVKGRTRGTTYYAPRP